MESRRDPRDAGRHLLGPHVVGRRVVVRRVLRDRTGPTGGPAFSDLLGVCLAWGDGVCVVRPEDGEPVSIPIHDVVSGKPVPPRPSVRHRVSVRDAELHTAALWPSVETAPLGAWVLRTDTAPVERLRRRGNSCLTVGDPGLPLDEAVARVRAFYEQRGRPVWAQVEAGSPVEDDLRRRGWAELTWPRAIEFRLASVARVRRSLRARAEPDGLVLDADGPRAVAAVGDLAAGRAAVDGDWIGLHALQVAPDHRRRGLATAVTAALLEWGAEQGCATAWVHVEAANVAALRFWEGLGFAWHHTCRYLEAPARLTPAPGTPAGPGG